MNKYNSIILAAGQGKRMNSNIPKVLHKVFDKTLIECVLDALTCELIKNKIVIVGVGKEKVIDSLKDRDILFAEQNEQLGTGHAVKCAKQYIKDDENYLIINGDMPLISNNTIIELLDYFEHGNFGACVVTTVLENPTGYGRIILQENGLFNKIVEEKDASDLEKQIKEANLGVYLFKGNLLKEALNKLTNNNKQGEYYLTDTLEIIQNLNENVGVFYIKDNLEAVNVNSRQELAKTTKIYLDKIIEKHMQNGVTFINKDTTCIGADVTIGKDTIIYPGCILEGKTTIGSDCTIGPNSHIISSKISNNTTVENSKVVDSTICDNCNIGPFAHIRPNNLIGNNSKVGAYVELKNSTFGEGTKASHLLYVGDSEIGNNVEFGCGVMTVNCDINFNKHKTIIEDNAFIGCNSALIAPIKIEENAIIAAGSTITNNVSKNSLAIARQKQINKENYNK